MIVTPVNTSTILITEVAGLDPIHAFWINLEPGQGYVTLICYGCAWTAYFGGMEGRTIEQFFSEADTDYLVTKLGITQFLKDTKQHRAYLGKIVNAVKAALDAGRETPERKERAA